MAEPGSLVGELLDGKYSIVGQLGEGGMGAVYLAKHAGTKRMVALKVIVPRMTTSEEFVARFRREAEAAGSLRHPNVVDVTDFGLAHVDGEEIAYLVMEYLDGCSLADVLAEEGALPLDWVVDILDQTCSAVDEAHHRGIVHRDLKPHNIWLEPNRRGGFTVKVLDFGLAKVHDSGLAPADRALTGRLAPPPAEHEGETLELQAHGATEAAGGTALWSGSGAASAAATAPQLTRVGTVLGTPYYMSPEQCRGGKVDERSDVYSLGIIAYEMLAGRRPFSGAPIDVMAKQVLDAPEPLESAAPGVPKGVAATVMSALAKNPDERPARAALFASTLRANAEGVGRILRRAVAISSENLPVFLKLFVIAYTPIVLIRTIRLATQLVDGREDDWLSLLWTYGFGVGVAGIAAFMASSIARGVSALLLAQLAVAPLRAVRINIALGVLRKQLWPLFLGAVIYLGLATVPLAIFYYAFNEFAAVAAAISRGRTGADFQVATVAWLAVALVSGYVTLRNFVTYALFPIVLLVESGGVLDALRRSKALVERDRDAVVPVAVVESLQWVVPLAFSFVATAVFEDWGMGLVALVGVSTLTQLVLSPIVALAYAMLYLKLRQVGGESVDDVLDEQYVKQDTHQSQWMQRMASPKRSHG